MSAQPQTSAWPIVIAQLKGIDTLITANAANLKGGSPEVREALGDLFISMGESFIEAGRQVTPAE